MAKMVTNPAIQSISGRLGSDMVIRRLADGRMVICRKPDFRHRKLSPAQELHHQKFREAAFYAREAAIAQPLYAQRAAAKMVTAYNLALADWFHPPVVQSIQFRDDFIRICATDDFLVASVDVSIFDAQGSLVEQGPALQTGKQWWEYLPQKHPSPGFRIVAAARDLAGNLTSAETTRK